MQPSNPSVDGIVGTSVLNQLVSTLDYPSGRFIARCATDGCLTYPRFTNGTNCGLPCSSPDTITASAASRPGGLCAKAP